jgi:outer membrane protein assembly factor BamB
MSRRQGAVVAIAAAVLMITAGAGVAVALKKPESSKPAVAAPLAGIRTMEAVGAPILAGGGRRWSQVVSADGRIYATRERDDAKGGASVTAFDAKTGRELWTSQQFGVFMDLGGPIAFPGGLLVRVGGTMHLVDPATGKVRWKFAGKDKDAYVTDSRTFVRMDAAGTTAGHDLSTGDKLWSVPAGADRPTLVTGMQTGAWDPTPSIFGPDIPFADDGLVQVTVGGQVVQRDIRTGAERQRVDAKLPGARTVTAYQGRVYTDFQGNDGGPYTVRATDVAGGTTDIVYTAPAETEVRNPEPCGTGRLCLREWDSWTSEGALVVTGSAAGQKTGFQVAPYLRTSEGGAILTDLVTTVVHGPDGQEVASGPGSGQWVDAGNVLWQEKELLSVVSVPAGRRTPLLDLTGTPGNCALTAELLACPISGQAELHIWRFVR